MGWGRYWQKGHPDAHQINAQMCKNYKATYGAVQQVLGTVIKKCSLE